MSTLEDWIADAAEALSLSPAAIPVDLRDSLLELTRDAAHGVARIAGPLTCYLVGLAVADGAVPSTVVGKLQGLLTARAAADSPTAPGAPDPPGGTEPQGGTQPEPHASPS